MLSIVRSLVSSPSIRNNSLSNGGGSFFPALDQVPRSFRPLRKAKFEAMFTENSRNDAATLEEKFCLRPHQECANRQHPGRRRQAHGDSPCLTQFRHKLLVRKWMRSREIHSARDFVVFDQKFHGSAKVQFMNPGHILASVTPGSSEAETDQPRNNWKNATRFRAHH